VIEGNVLPAVWEGEVSPHVRAIIRGKTGDIEPRAQHDKVVQEVRAGKYQ
jgi:hypothetical protein